MFKPIWFICFLSLVSAMAFAYEFPVLSDRVVDEANLLSPETKAELVARLAAHEQETSNQVVVATVGSLEGASIDDYGVELARHWGIGQKDKDNGVVLLIAPTERKMRIDVGYGLEGTLTDALCSIIIDRRLRPAFKAGDFEIGIKSGVDGILDVLSDHVPEDLKEPGSSNTLEGLVVPAMFIIFVISELFGGRNQGGGKKKNLVPALTFGSIGGVTAAAMANSLIIGGIAAATLFLFIWLGESSGGSGRGGSGRSSRSSGSGGFSGGGGSFGGGGSSGGW